MFGAQVSLALFLSGETAQASRAIAALGALYSRADHAATMDKMTGARLAQPRPAAAAALRAARRARCAPPPTPPRGAWRDAR
jgi:hypothetical protein